MPKIDLDAVEAVVGSLYPAPYDAPCAKRVRRRLAAAGGLTDFGVNLTLLPPGAWSSQRHWHSEEEEFVYVLSGTLVLVEDGGESTLGPGACAAFAKASGNGHHLVNRSNAVAAYLEIGSRRTEDVTVYSDIDMMVAGDGVFRRKH